MNAEVEINSVSIAVCTDVDSVWSVVRPMLQKVVTQSPDDLSIEKIYHRLVAGNDLLILISTGTEFLASITMRIKTTDTGVRVLYLPVVSGNKMDTWLDKFLDFAKEIARDHQCTQIRGTGRNGWVKKLKSRGWNDMFTTIAYNVEG